MGWEPGLLDSSYSHVGFSLWSLSDSWRRHSLNLQQEVTNGFDCIIQFIGIFKEGSQVLKALIYVSETSKI